MKKSFAAVCAAVTLALPVAPAAASEIPPYAGTKRCPAPYTHGTIVWTDTPVTPYEEHWFCIPGGPGDSTTSDSSARAGVTRCGAAGHYIVWYYDLNNEYHEVWNSCI
jgi:hypothetical protein